jgi:enoyl-CoA hydratase/carnithine racemase
MSLMGWEKIGTVAKITMTAGKNLHNPDYIAALLSTFDEIEADADVKAVVLTADDEKNFSQGIDLEWILGAFGDPARHGEIKGFMRGLNAMFTRLLTTPVPVIAAINGHAFGDGAIMACACDFRFMRADKGFFCFPEVDVNIPFMPAMLACCQKAIPEAQLNMMYLTGQRCNAEQLAATGALVKASADVPTMIDDAMAFAGTFHKNRGVFGEIKRRKYAYILDIMEKDDEPIIEALSIMA